MRSFKAKFLTGDNIVIFIVQESTMILSTRIIELDEIRFFVSGSLIPSRIELQENIIVACSRVLIVIRSEDLVLRCFRVLRTTESGHCTQCQNLISRNNATCPTR